MTRKEKANKVSIMCLRTVQQVQVIFSWKFHLSTAKTFPRLPAAVDRLISGLRLRLSKPKF